MFHEKINKLLTTTHARSKNIAQYASIHPATISKLRTGKLTLKPSSPTILKLISGIVLYAKDNDKLENIYQMLEEDGILTNENNLENNLKIWFYSDSEEADDENDTMTPFSSFGSKLSEIMQLADLSNVRLGHLINMDSSNISRYRNGHRTPKFHSVVVTQLCQVLIDQFSTQKKMDVLIKQIHAPAEAATDEDILFLHLRKWLFNYESDDKSAIGQLLQNMDSLTLVQTNDLPPFSSIATDDVLNDNSSYYVGDKGLQTAVIRFLSSAVTCGAKELFLYSDQGMEWMMEDDEFRVKWLTLMSECIKQGIYIKIIHHIERDISEMIYAIRSWMPLYMSGMIESYYCTLKNGLRFSHTLFLCPEVACIEAYHTAEGQTRGPYNYYTDKEPLECFQLSFHNLLRSCKLLVSMQIGKTAEKMGKSISANEEYNNICITINKSSVVVTRITPPYISFVFLHPLMYEAFKAFVEQQS